MENCSTFQFEVFVSRESSDLGVFGGGSSSVKERRILQEDRRRVLRRVLFFPSFYTRSGLMTAV